MVTLLVAGGEFETVAHSTETVRAIGLLDNIDQRRTVAASLAASCDVLVMALSDELSRLDDEALSLGIETLAGIGTPILLLLGDESPNELTRAAEWLRRHVRGVLSFDADDREVVAAVRAVRGGLVVIEPRMAESLVSASAAQRRRGPSASQATREPGSSLPLSAREREVLALLAEGHATKHIAFRLGISAHTVKAHVESIFEKFGATTRAEAVAIGVRRGAVLL